MIPKPKKKVKNSTLTARADAIARRACYERGHCQAAGSAGVACGGSNQWCHIVGRRNYRLRWSQLNCLLMCAQHHQYYTRNPAQWMAFVQLRFPIHYAFVIEHEHERWDGVWPTEVVDG